jgi:glycosyltransferase involved in cell wall biosynthesis
MIGVVVPAHNEEASIAACLAAIRLASRHPALAGEPVEVVVVLDACEDATGAIAEGSGVETLAVHGRNVGAARAAGARRLIDAGARWLAFTDADSEVPPDWIASQLAQDADAVCGIVVVDDWAAHPPQVRQRYEAAYVARDGHRHVHGANLSVSTAAYLRAGGFPPLRTSEDVALVDALSTTGARIAWSGAVRVRTSARTLGRAPAGFAAHLASLGAPGGRDTIAPA